MTLLYVIGGNCYYCYSRCCNIVVVVMIAIVVVNVVIFAAAVISWSVALLVKMRFVYLFILKSINLNQTIFFEFIILAKQNKSKLIIIIYFELLTIQTNINNVVFLITLPRINNSPTLIYISPQYIYINY